MRKPITYKSIPTQYAFFQEGNKVKVKQLTELPKEQEFKSEAEAVDYVKNIKEIL